MIQDLLNHRLDNRYCPGRVPQPDDAVISYADRKILISEIDGEKRLVFPTVEEYVRAVSSTLADAADKDTVDKDFSDKNTIHKYIADNDTTGKDVAEKNKESTDPSVTASPFTSLTEHLIYLFAVDQRAFFLTMEHLDLSGFSYSSLRDIRAKDLHPQEYVFAAFTAVHLGEWYRRKRYCGACGLLLRHDDRERAMRCPSCGEVFYPRINPAVIVGVVDHDRLLITRYLRGYGHNALVAGFAEIGEALEETVAREVMEETGLRVKNIRYYKSQPWGIASDLLAGFFCDVDGSTQVKLDGQELRSAIWTPREKITWQPPEYSLTADMMKAFHEGRA